jgi:hypothetical protein
LAAETAWRRLQRRQIDRRLGDARRRLADNFLALAVVRRTCVGLFVLACRRDAGGGLLSDL